MVSRTFNIFASKAPPKATRDALDVAARYFIYKLYDATRREPTQWASLKGIDESPATIARAVELGWVVFQPGRGGKSRTNEAALTERTEGGAQGEVDLSRGWNQGCQRSKTAKLRSIKALHWVLGWNVVAWIWAP